MDSRPPAAPSVCGVALVNIARCPAHGRMPDEHEHCRECGEALEVIPMIPADYFTLVELKWLESRARGSAGEQMAKSAQASDALMELAGKLRRLRVPS